MARLRAFVQGVKLRGNYAVKSLGEGHFVYQGRTIDVAAFGPVAELYLDSIDLEKFPVFAPIPESKNKRVKNKKVRRDKRATLVTNKDLFQSLIRD